MKKNILEKILDRKADKFDLYFLIILLSSILLFASLLGQISISAIEAKEFYSGTSFVHYAMKLGVYLLGQNIYGLHLVFFGIFAINLILFYLICRIYMRLAIYAIITTIIFAFLPGVVISVFMVSKTSLVIFLALISSYLTLRFKYIPYFILAIACLIESSAVILFLAYMIYSIKENKNKTFLFCLIGAIVNLYLYDLGIKGVPSNNFIEALIDMMLLFSPILFLYYIYSIYRATFKGGANILVYISVICILSSLLISLRQKVDFETILPMCVVGLPVCMGNMLGSVNIRLKRYRKNYLAFLIFTLILMGVESFLLINNKIIYLFNIKPSFALTHYIALELSQELKERNIYKINTDSNLKLRLKFYGIKDGSSYRLVALPFGVQGDINIKYLGKIAQSYNIISQ